MKGASQRIGDVLTRVGSDHNRNGIVFTVSVGANMIYERKTPTAKAEDDKKNLGKDFIP